MKKEKYNVISDNNLMDLTQLYRIDTNYLIDRIFGNKLIERKKKLKKICGVITEENQK